MSRERIEPEPGQESVWDYPRPPRVEESNRTVRVVFNGVTVAETRNAKRVLETSHPPVYYIPPEDVRQEYLKATGRVTSCEFKGRAGYATLSVDGRESRDAAWFYPDPLPGFEAIKNHLAFYPGRVDECTLDDVKVAPQEGDFYGGWVTKEIVGPFKGAPGTWGW